MPSRIHPTPRAVSRVVARSKAQLTPAKSRRRIFLYQNGDLAVVRGEGSVAVFIMNLLVWSGERASLRTP
jgi:hypothetical protein